MLASIDIMSFLPGALFALSVLALLLMVGMARLTLRTQNADGEAVSLDAHVEDDHADDSTSAIQRYAELETESAVAEVRQDLEVVTAERDAMRDLMVGEILRRKQLAGLVADGEDAKDGQLKVEDEREYLLGLPAERLKMEYERAPKPAELSAEAKTKPGKPAKEGNDDYDEAVSGLT